MGRREAGPHLTGYCTHRKLQRDLHSPDTVHSAQSRGRPEVPAEVTVRRPAVKFPLWCLPAVVGWWPLGPDARQPTVSIPSGRNTASQKGCALRRGSKGFEKDRAVAIPA